VPAVAQRAAAAAPRCGSTRLVCIDGPAGSGKTTLAAALATALGDAPVVHMDDLYEGWDQQLGPALAERVDAWVLDPLRSGSAGRYRRFDWAAGRFAGDWVRVPAAPVVILEGCASASRQVRAWASLVIWVEAPEDVRLRRGLERDGEAMAAQWRAWQRHEAAHFAADGTRGAADLIIDGTTGAVIR
jgi:uridine kinase